MKATSNIVNDKDVHYEAFDFHRECSKMRSDTAVLVDTDFSNGVKLIFIC